MTLHLFRCVKEHISRSQKQARANGCACVCRRANDEESTRSQSEKPFYSKRRWRGRANNERWRDAARSASHLFTRLSGYRMGPFRRSDAARAAAEGLIGGCAEREGQPSARRTLPMPHRSSERCHCHRPDSTWWREDCTSGSVREVLGDQSAEAVS